MPVEEFCKVCGDEEGDDVVGEVEDGTGGSTVSVETDEYSVGVEIGVRVLRQGKLRRCM